MDAVVNKVEENRLNSGWLMSKAQLVAKAPIAILDFKGNWHFTSTEKSLSKLFYKDKLHIIQYNIVDYWIEVKVAK